MSNPIEIKSFDFSIRIVNLYKYLTLRKKEYIMAKQLLRSGTSIGANVAEGEKGQSRADFHAKMSVALKEAYETHYWLRLLHRTEYLPDQGFASMERDVKEIIAILTAICRKTKE